MIIKEILAQLPDATAPVVKVIQKGEGFKVIGIGLKKSVILKEHKTALPAKLLVLVGKVKYREEGVEVNLEKYDEKEIPVLVYHSLEAMENSICILIQG